MRTYKQEVTIKQFGISLLEVMLSLTIIALIMVAATRYYQVTQNARQIKNSIENIQVLYAAGQNYLMNNQDYANPPLTTNLISTFKNLNLLPQNFENYLNPWQVVIPSADIAICAGNTSFSVKFGNVPTEACNSISSKITSAYNNSITINTASCETTSVCPTTVGNVYVTFTNK